MDNTSGQGKSAVVPAEIDRWNWGAFLLNWIWGIGNDTYIALLMFVPGVNLVMLFVLGFKGNTWAWRNKRWIDIEHFKRVQRKWAIWGAIVWVGLIGFYVALFLLFLTLFKHAEAYQMAVARLAESPSAIAALGTPISTGFPWGNISISGPSGRARLSFWVGGPKAEGTVYLDATKNFGRWTINRMELEINGRADRIDLSNNATRISY
jgi:cytochrome oxidase complex assembly protein 1